MTSIYIMGEVGQAHEGNIALAHAYIDALAECGVDAVKFQIHIAEAESSIHEPFRVPLRYCDETRMEYWRRMEFTEKQWVALKDHCESRGLDFVASPFSIEAVELLERIGVTTFKIGSGEVNNPLMLERIAESGRDIILSSGMSSLTELDNAVEFLKNRNCRISLLQCTSAYPTAPRQWGINMIVELDNRYQIPIGFSDHSGDIFACLAAASSGARLLEFHIVFDKRMPGPDATSSLTIAQATEMIRGVRQIEMALSNPVDKSDCSGFENLKVIFGKSLAVNKSLKKGHKLTFEDLEAKKPAGFGISPKYFGTVLCQALTRDIQKCDFLTEAHL
ncbi:N-acetylneuraminate synthase family protein [Dyadobacter luticola]|uniref:N-acetylneuraminate synthase n=1 Tax=Dyadobacter luticola TaxID=1979387 RepID=A0A5R9KPT9_9BACT|nr:N-acetylneuraminate synthase family protein [Dyadobacter luticola]TLU98200.1 N-acetylneuraminate synthase [Dyadobacter luticola]